jgi:hypothetical protein
VAGAGLPAAGDRRSTHAAFRSMEPGARRGGMVSCRARGDPTLPVSPGRDRCVADAAAVCREVGVMGGRPPVEPDIVACADGVDERGWCVLGSGLESRWACGHQLSSTPSKW